MPADPAPSPGRPSSRILKGMEAFANIAKVVAELEAERDRAWAAVSERDSTIASLDEELQSVTPVDELLDELADMERGLRTPGEVYAKWLDYTWEPKGVVKAA